MDNIKKLYINTDDCAQPKAVACSLKQISIFSTCNAISDVE